MIKIAIDAFGGDHAPHAVVEGALEALRDYDDIEITLCGREDAIREELRESKYD